MEGLRKFPIALITTSKKLVIMYNIPFPKYLEATKGLIKTFRNFNRNLGEWLNDNEERFKTVVEALSHHRYETAEFKAKELALFREEVKTKRFPAVVGSAMKILREYMELVEREPRIYTKLPRDLKEELYKVVRDFTAYIIVYYYEIFDRNPELKPTIKWFESIVKFLEKHK